MPPFAVLAASCVVVATVTGCSAGSKEGTSRPTIPSPSVPSQSSGPSESPSSPPVSREPTVPPDAGAVMDTVRRLAAGGPREATSEAYRRAAQEMAAELRGLGYEVSRQPFRVPAGNSWGIPVGAGRTVNVVAQLPGQPDAQRPVVIGAHLDTVPQAPGAEDNASGVGVVVELARLAAQSPLARPVTFVLFGAEEPRGPGDDEHHFGSQAYVRRVESGAVPAPAVMVSLDRVGAPGRVPVCTGGLSPRSALRDLVDTARSLDVPVRACENRTSDHWPFEKAGHTVARVGGNDYAGYHSARDLPGVVDRRQLDRVLRTVWAWLRSG